MKGLLVFATVFILLSQVFCINKEPLNSSNKRLKYIKKHMIRPTHQDARTGANSKCSFCIQFMEQALNQLINIILNTGVVGSCGVLCKKLEEKTGNVPLEVACTLVCDAVGVEEFIKLIKKVDIDPIYMCEEIDFCPINDYGDCQIKDFEINPSSGPQGKFMVYFQYVSQNGTGTGQIAIKIDTVDKIPVGGRFLHELAKSGVYHGNINLNATPDPSCDPSQQLCEKWLPGEYTVKMAICNGECGSKHPHSQIYDIAQTTFIITG